MTAGRELDALVAEKVMGIPPEYITLGPPASVLSESGGTWIDVQPVRHYSTDIVAAWEVVEKLVALKLAPDVTYRGRGEWGCTVDSFSSDDTEAERWPLREVAETAPLAICFAALKAVEATAEVSR